MAIEPKHAKVPSLYTLISTNSLKLTFDTANQKNKIFLRQA
ncbi:hypothetical protein DSUL_170035 [Desulfovibrionales bacterium]